MDATFAFQAAVSAIGIIATFRELSKLLHPSLQRDGERLTPFGIRVLDNGPENPVAEYGF